MGFFDKIFKPFKKAGEFVGHGFDKVIHWGPVNSITNTVGNAFNTGMKIINTGITGAGNLFSGAVGSAQQIVGGVGNLAQGAGEGAKGLGNILQYWPYFAIAGVAFMALRLMSK